jgi:hypothetical protein
LLPHFGQRNIIFFMARKVATDRLVLGIDRSLRERSIIWLPGVGSK